MASTYDDSFHPPPWWLTLVDEKLELDEKWTDGWLAKAAALVDGRAPKWGADRVSKMRKGSATIQLVVACSKVLDIAAPVFLPRDENEADALRIWLRERERSVEKSPKTEAKLTEVAQALAGQVKRKQDQTKPVRSSNEGSPRGLGPRRAPRSR